MGIFDSIKSIFTTSKPRKDTNHAAHKNALPASKSPPVNETAAGKAGQPMDKTMQYVMLAGGVLVLVAVLKK